MKNVYQYLQTLRTVLETNNFSKARCVEVGVYVDNDKDLMVGAHFTLKICGQEKLISVQSSIQSEYMTQFSEDKILKQVIGDLLFKLETEINLKDNMH